MSGGGAYYFEALAQVVTLERPECVVTLKRPECVERNKVTTLRTSASGYGLNVGVPIKWWMTDYISSSSVTGIFYRAQNFKKIEIYYVSLTLQYSWKAEHYLSQFTF